MRSINLRWVEQNTDDLEDTFCVDAQQSLEIILVCQELDYVMKIGVPHLLSDGPSRELFAIDKEVQGPQYLIAEVSLTSLDLQLIKAVIRGILERCNVNQIMMSNLQRLGCGVCGRWLILGFNRLLQLCQ